MRPGLQIMYYKLDKYLLGLTPFDVIKEKLALSDMDIINYIDFGFRTKYRWFYENHGKYFVSCETCKLREANSKVQIRNFDNIMIKPEKKEKTR